MLGEQIPFPRSKKDNPASKFMMKEPSQQTKIEASCHQGSHGSKINRGNTLQHQKWHTHQESMHQAKGIHSISQIIIMAKKLKEGCVKHRKHTHNT